MNNQRFSLTERAALGLSLKVAGILVIAAGFFGLLWAVAEDESLFVVLAVLAFFLIGPMIWRFGTRIGSSPAEEVLRYDKRQPILYLRSFSEEAAAHRFFRVIREMFDSYPIFPSFSQWAPMEQYQFGRLMNRIGPYIGIARPGESLQELGAAWLEVSENEWQQKVGELLERARFVVIRAGTSPGLKWEIGEVLKRLPPTRILLITPSRRKDYRSFSEWINQALPKPLPEKIGDVRLITCTQSGSPIPLDPHGKSTPEEILDPLLSANSITLEKRSWFSNVRSRQ